MTPSNFNISAQRRKLNTSLSFSNKPLEKQKTRIRKSNEEVPTGKHLYKYFQLSTQE